MAFRTISFENDIFQNGWKKERFGPDSNCNLGTVTYNGVDDIVEHDMEALNLSSDCPDQNTSYVSFGKYNLMYPSSENVIEWNEFVDNIFTQTNSVIKHDHYFFCNAEKVSNLETGYFVRVVDEREMEIGKLENGTETILRHFNIDLPTIRTFQLQYKFDDARKNATLRLRIIDSNDDILRTEQVIDTSPFDRLEPDKADPGYLNVVHYDEINNINSNPFYNDNDEEFYHYEIWGVTVVEQLSNIIQDLTKDGRFYEKNSSLAVDLKWSNLGSNVTDSLEEVVLRRRENTFPKDHTDGTEIKRITSPVLGNEVIATDNSIDKNKEYYYAVFVKFDGSWTDKVRRYKNAIIVDTSNIPPIRIVDNFTADSISNSFAQIGWSNPNDEQLDQYRVVRRKDGFPEDHDDGDVVVDEQNPEPGNFVNKNDFSIQPGNFYYYAVFTKRTAGDIWNDKVIFSG